MDGTFDEWVDKNGNGIMDVGDAQQLNVTNSHLTVSNVNSTLRCAGLISNGDAATFTGTYNYYPQTAPNANPSGWINILP